MIATHCYGFTIRFALRDKDRERAEHWQCLRSSASATLQGEFDPPVLLDDARAELHARVLGIITEDQYVAISRLYTRPGKTHYVGL